MKGFIFLVYTLFCFEALALEDVSTLLRLPKGFKVEVVAQVDGARSMALTQSGSIVLGTRGPGTVWFLPYNKDGDKYGSPFPVMQNLNSPNGVAIKGNDLYVAEIHRILKFKNVDSIPFRKKGVEPEVVYSNLPKDEHHGWRYIRLSPEGELVISLGAPCNVCDLKNKKYANISSLNLQTKKLKVLAKGVRNSVGFDWHPQTKNLWFTDNGRDWLGDNKPSCELNQLEKMGAHFGFPYCHGGDVLDPEYGKGKSCASYTPPIHKLGAHIAPLGLWFYRGMQFPVKGETWAFIAEHGSWNRSKKVGYKIGLLKLNPQGQVDSYTTFIQGWLKPDESVKGRPVDIIEDLAGRLLISDDYSGRIYRVSYNKVL